MAILGHGFHVLRFSAVQLGAFPEHFLDAARHGAVRIFFRIALGMVLAVDGGPLLGDLARRQPQPETEEMAGQRMQFQRPVGLVAVQVNRDAGDRDVGDHHGIQENLPCGQIGNASCHELQNVV
ncbi:hypothetical protein D3C72_1610050 [compost metagenome]